MSNSLGPKLDGGAKLFLVRVRDALLSLPFDCVTRVLPLMELQPVPDAPAYVRGMFNYRGGPVLAVDMVERLGRQNDVPYTLDTPVVLCRYKQRSVGLLVDEVLGLMASEEDTNLEDTFKNAIPPFTGVIRTQEKLALQVDFERLLDFDLTLDATDLDVDPSELLAQASS